MAKYYVVVSRSEEGIYYLVNGWRKYCAFWDKHLGIRNLFKRKQDAKMALTKLLKVMSEYAQDDFEIMEINLEELS